MFEVYATIFIGRFITGFCAGIYQMCLIKAINETIPSSLLGQYGIVPGAFLALGCFLVSIIGWITLPADEKDYMDN